LSYYIKRDRGDNKLVAKDDRDFLLKTFPSAASSESGKVRRKRMNIVRLSKVLHVDVRKANDIYEEYLQHTSHDVWEKIPTDPQKMRHFYCKEIEDIRNFYFKQRYALLKLISHIVMNATSDLVEENVEKQNLVDELVRGIVDARGDDGTWCVLEYVQHLLEWEIPYDADRFLLEGDEERKDEECLTYGIDNKYYNLLDALCTTREQKVALIRENRTEWCEQIIAEFDVALEIFSFFMHPLKAAPDGKLLFDHGVSLEQLKNLFTIDEGVVSLGAPKVPLKHLEAITRGLLPDYIQMLKSRISLSWIYIMNPENSYLKVEPLKLYDSMS
jgi:CRISPR/Cas system CSM-associated protein Csm2 small subunit